MAGGGARARCMSLFYIGWHFGKWGAGRWWRRSSSLGTAWTPETPFLVIPELLVNWFAALNLILERILRYIGDAYGSIGLGALPSVGDRGRRPGTELLLRGHLEPAA